MKMGLLLLAISFAVFTAKACSCMDGLYCEYYGYSPTDLGTSVYGYKISDVGDNGIRFKVIDSWGNALTNDTITIWNDSLHLADVGMIPGAFFDCEGDTRNYINENDTFLVKIQPHYAGSGFSAPGEYLFYHNMCRIDILRVTDKIVRDSNWISTYVIDVIEETITDYKNRLLNNSGCEPTYTITSFEELALNKVEISIQDKQLNVFVSGLQSVPSRVNVYSLSAQLVYTSFNSIPFHDLSAFCPGIYIAEVEYNGHIHRQKIVLY